MSDRHPGSDDMRAEYDFSQGIRGKHARFSVSREEPAPDWLRAAIRSDTQAWISEALRSSQEVEVLLVVYLALAFQLEPSDAGKSVSSLLEDPKDERLRRISADLEASAPLTTSDLGARLARLVSERNWLVHRSLYPQAEEVQPSAAGRFTARLQKLTSENATTGQRLRELIVAKFVRAGMTEDEYEQKAQAVIEQWLAA